MIQIEVFGADKDSLQVAFYFPVPDLYWKPEMADAAREPAGVSLSSSELALLKQGKLVELRKNLDRARGIEENIKAQLVDRWGELRVPTVTAFVKEYEFISRRYDDVDGWS